MNLDKAINELVARWRKNAVLLREDAEYRWSTGQTEQSTRLNLYADFTESYATELEHVAFEYVEQK